MGSDTEQDYFADGISEDIITALAKWRWLFVIGLLMAIGMNFDTIRVAQHLMREPQARAVLVDAAQKQVAESSQDAKTAMKALQGLELPIGWGEKKRLPEERMMTAPPIPKSWWPVHASLRLRWFEIEVVLCERLG